MKFWELFGSFRRGYLQEMQSCVHYKQFRHPTLTPKQDSTFRQFAKVYDVHNVTCQTMQNPLKSVMIYRTRRN
jgi:hypothetical protein